MGLGSLLLRLGGVWIQSVGGVKRLIALYYVKIVRQVTDLKDPSKCVHLLGLVDLLTL